MPIIRSKTTPLTGIQSNLNRDHPANAVIAAAGIFGFSLVSQELPSKPATGVRI
jgi:hypothetical protein